MRPVKCTDCVSFVDNRCRDRRCIMYDVVRDPEIMIPMFCGWYNQVKHEEPDERRQAVIDAIKAGTSITQAAKDAGVTRQTASKWWNDEKDM